jgi:hypothetical protein
MIRRLASLHWLRQGAVRQLQRYYQDAMTSCRPSRRTSLPSLGGTSAFHSLGSLPGGRVHRRGLELVTRYLRPGSRRGNDRTSQVPGEPRLSVCTCSGDAGRTARTRPVHSAAAWPSVYEQRRLPREVFRRSMAWLSDSLCTLRSAGYPRPTQHSLPAAGQALPDGLSTRRIPMKGFRFASYISSSFPKLLAAITSTQVSKDPSLARVGRPRRCLQTHAANLRRSETPNAVVGVQNSLKLHRLRQESLGKGNEM